MRKLRELNIRVIAGSADDLDTARKGIVELGIEYDIAWGLNVDTVARQTGAFYEVYKEAHPVYHSPESEAEITNSAKSEVRKFLQPTGFILNPEKKIEVSCYSSAHLGRITGKDVYTLVKYLNEKREQKQVGN
jgi:hypothetical protein